MKLPLSTLTSRLSTSALQLIDCPFDHRSVGKEGLSQPPHLVDELNKGLAKLAEPSLFSFYSVCSLLYKHTDFETKIMEKINPLKNFSIGNRKEISRSLK
jgi:hypothetical protein